MAVAKVIEITAGSPDGFEAAVKAGVAKAGESVRGIQAAWVKEHQVIVKDGAVSEYRVTMKVTFVLD